MVRITFVEASGAAHVVEVETDLSVMRAAVTNAIPGILADCGGSASCGTCRVYVAQEWREITGSPSDDEEAMLALHDADTRPGQRLSCQIAVTGALDGLVVHLPERQF